MKSFRWSSLVLFINTNYSAVPDLSSADVPEYLFDNYCDANKSFMLDP